MPNSKKRNIDQLKDIVPYKMRQAVGSSDKLFIKSFAGADIEAMEHCESNEKTRERIDNTTFLAFLRNVT